LDLIHVKMMRSRGRALPRFFLIPLRSWRREISRSQLPPTRICS
jgi:hypothetical protein